MAEGNFRAEDELDDETTSCVIRILSNSPQISECNKDQAERTSQLSKECQPSLISQKFLGPGKRLNFPYPDFQLHRNNSKGRGQGDLPTNRRPKAEHSKVSSRRGNSKA